MKIKTKKRITFIAFLAFAIASIVLCTVFMLNNHVTHKDNRKIYQSTELIQMKRGEKLAFSDANEYFEEIKNKYGDKFQVHSQGAYHLSQALFNNNPDEVSSMIYIDEDGYINAEATGVYQLEYAFAIETKTDEKENGYDVECCTLNTFTALICVYEGDEDKFYPLPDTPQEVTGNYREPVNYIMTKDITWEVDRFWTVGSFYGTLINPDGYTLTWDITGNKNQGRKKQVEALVSENHGYIDGLKVKIVSDKEQPIEIGDFYGLVERNQGVLQNCEIEGTVYLSNPELSYGPTNFYALPQHGFSFNNEARLTVYSDAYIDAYETTGLRESDVAERCWQSKNNRVYLDAWYYQDEVKAQRRVVETIEATDSNSNTCEHLIYGKTESEEKTVTIQVPQLMQKGEKNYAIYSRRMQKNSPLEIEREMWQYIRWSLFHINCYDNLEVKYWLVNGERVDNLNDIVVTEDLRIEPFVQYKETKIYSSHGSWLTLGYITNTDETLVLDASAEENLALSLYDLGHMLSDPRCVIPNAIYVGKNYQTKTVLGEVEQGGLTYLLHYLQEGGELIIDNENPYMSFINGRAFCNAQGTELYYYFEGKGETEVTLHPQIETIANKNAFWNGENYRKLNLSKVKMLNQQIGDTLTNMQEIQIGKELTQITGGATNSNINHFLSRMPYLSKVEVHESHLTLRSKDNFVYEEGFGVSTLLYAPKALKGEVNVPAGIMKLNDGCFNGSNIQHLIFPDSLTEMNMDALTGMKSLEKITFGASDRIVFYSKTELPTLTSIVFDGTKDIDGESTCFMYANVDTIELSKELESFIDIFIDCKEYQVAEENHIWKSVDGVLYNMQDNTLAMYPKKKVGESYTVLEDTGSVGANAFYETKLKTVVFPDTCTQIGSYAFNNSQIESITFKSKSEIELVDHTFFSCLNLSNVSLEKEATIRLGQDTFRGCANLKEFPYENVVFIGASAFRESGIEYFEIGEDVEYFLSAAFKDSALKNIVIKTQPINGNDVIPTEAFANTPLESVDLGDSILYIQPNAFEGCTNLKTINLKNVKSISADAFRESGLESVESEIVELIGASAFANCKNLTHVNFPNVTDVYGWAFAQSGVKIVEMKNAQLVDSLAFTHCEELVYISLANGVRLGSNTFTNCIRLEELPFTVSQVDHQTFSGCTALKKITIEGNVSTSSTFVFENCTALEEVNVIGNNIQLGEGFFSGCTALKKVFITHMGVSNGSISSSAFDISATAEVYLNVPNNFAWTGKVPANVTVYVPEECLASFKEEWLVEDNQIQAYDFSNREDE